MAVNTFESESTVWHNLNMDRENNKYMNSFEMIISSMLQWINQSTYWATIKGPKATYKSHQYATSGQSNFTWDHIAATDGWFNRIRQVAPTCLTMWEHWRHLANTIELVLPSAHPPESTIPQSKRQIDWFGRSCKAHSRKSLHLQWPRLSPKIAPSDGDIWTPI